MTVADGSVVGMTQILNNGPAANRFNIVVLGDGYQAAQLGQYAADVQSFVTALRATPPYTSLMPALNVFRVDVTSTDSDARDPVACGGTGAAPRTYFDATFCSAPNTRRLLTVNRSTALAVAAARVPQFHLVMVFVNSTVYGGSGAATVAVQSRASGAAEIAFHELGHSAFNLADEYHYLAGCGTGGDPPGSRDRYLGGEPFEPNVTVDPNRTTNKWRKFVLGTTPMPTATSADCTTCAVTPSPVPAGAVGAFEGARYFHCGVYRPEFNCKMRALEQPFCAVCRDVISRKLAPFMPRAWAAYQASANHLLSIKRSTGEIDLKDASLVQRTTGTAAGMTMFREKLHLAFQTDDASHALNLQSSADGIGFTATGTLHPGLRSRSAPALAVFRDTLYTALQAEDDHVLNVARSSDGRAFGRATRYPSIKLGGTPAFAVFRDKLYVAFQADDPTHWLCLVSSTDGSRFTAVDGQATPAVTSYPGIAIGTAPALAVFRDKLYVAFQANDSSHALSITRSSDGITFSPSTVYPALTISGTPGLAVFRDSLCATFQADTPTHNLCVTASHDGTTFAAPTVLSAPFGFLGGQTTLVTT